MLVCGRVILVLVVADVALGSVIGIGIAIEVECKIGSESGAQAQARARPPMIVAQRVDPAPLNQ